MFAFRFLSFASVFLLLSLCLLSFYALCLSSGALSLLFSACPLACLVCSCVVVGFVFSFSLSDYTQKERAQRFVPCVLSCPVVGCCYAFANCSRASCHTFSASSGFSPQLFHCWRLAPKYRQSNALSLAASLAVILFALFISIAFSRFLLSFSLSVICLVPP